MSRSQNRNLRRSGRRSRASLEQQTEQESDRKRRTRNRARRRVTTARHRPVDQVCVDRACTNMARMPGSLINIMMCVDTSLAIDKREPEARLKNG